jgi:thiamine biosynthesis protein ThiS
VSSSPTFILNDEPRAWQAGLTVDGLLHELDPAMPIAVVKIDGHHVPRRTWREREIRPDEQVRVVYIIAGG